MLFELIYYTLSAILAIILASILYNVIIVSLALSKFKRKSRGIRMMDGFSLIDGHIRSIMFKNHLFYYILDYAKKYGNTFAYMYRDKPAIVTLDLDLLARVIVDEKYLNRTSMNLPLEEFEKDSIVLASNEQWRRIRKAFAPALKESRFKTPNVEKNFDSSISKLIETIEKQFHEMKSKRVIELNFDDLIHRFSMDLILSSFFKQKNLISFDLNKPDHMVKSIDDAFEMMWKQPILKICIAFPILSPILEWLIMNFHEFGVLRAQTKGFIKQHIRTTLEARKQLVKWKREGKKIIDEENFILDDGSEFNQTLTDHIIDQYHAGKLNTQELFNSSYFLLEAADKTATDSILFTIYQLGIDQEIQEKLRQSILIDGEKSKYMSWVLNESLRLMPPVQAGCSRMIERDLLVDGGILIPANTFLISPAQAIHRLPEYWGQDAEEFKPERFANTDHFHPFQYIPFGAGPRMCPGKEFALYEMKKLLCALLTRYKLECEPMDEMRYNAPFYTFLLPDKPTIVRLSKLEY